VLLLVGLDLIVLHVQLGLLDLHDLLVVEGRLPDPGVELLAFHLKAFLQACLLLE